MWSRGSTHIGNRNIVFDNNDIHIFAMSSICFSYLIMFWFSNFDLSSILESFVNAPCFDEIVSCSCFVIQLMKWSFEELLFSCFLHILSPSFILEEFCIPCFRTFVFSITRLVFFIDSLCYFSTLQCRNHIMQRNYSTCQKSLGVREEGSWQEGTP